MRHKARHSPHADISPFQVVQIATEGIDVGVPREKLGAADAFALNDVRAGIIGLHSV